MEPTLSNLNHYTEDLSDSYKITSVDVMCSIPITVGLDSSESIVTLEPDKWTRLSMGGSGNRQYGI